MSAGIHTRYESTKFWLLPGTIQTLPCGRMAQKVSGDGRGPWRVLTYSADTGESPALVRPASQADLLLSEASFLAGPAGGRARSPGRRGLAHAHACAAVVRPGAEPGRGIGGRQ